MTLIRPILIAIMMMAAASTRVLAQNVKVPQAYMFGFVASFNDSTVYFTGIQQVDSVWVSRKKHFLAGRNQYSYQLREYFANTRQLPHRTCMVIAGLDRKKVEKKYIKMKDKYLVKSKKSYDVRNIADSDFRFTAVDMSGE